MEYSAPPDLLQDKVVLVTGAGAGIGRAAAMAYARHGATVILLGRTVSRLESVYDEITATGAAEPAIMPMNLETVTPEAIQQMADTILERYGRLDGLLHNAAILGDRVPLEHYDLNTWHRVMQVNLNAVFLLTRLLLPLMRLPDTASMIFTSSGVGTKPRAYWGAYSVSKYAMEGLAKLLFEELENTSGIRVNILNPGATRTAMRAAAFPMENPGELKTAEDLMGLYLYLMGDDSRHENGKLFTG